MQNIRLLLTEDLSPHKIAVLFLAGLYCQNQLAPDAANKVMGVIIRFLCNELVYDKHKGLVVVPTFTDLFPPSSSPEIQQLLLQALWSIQSIEDLDSKLSTIMALVVEPTVIFSSGLPVKQISSRSLVGVFISKIVTAFKLLKFEEVFLLYDAFVEYREDTRELFLFQGGAIKDESQPEGTNDTLLFNKLNSSLQESMGTTVPFLHQSVPKRNARLLPVPKHDLQVILDKQIHLLETYGTPTPQILKDIMYIMTLPDSNTCLIQNINFNNLPSYYYIKYLENLRESNYNGAFEALHQYFDYMVSNNSKYFYHFALISRASLHQFFGEDEKAIDAIEEAISVARENKDNTTLTYILSWLFNFIKNKPELWQRQSLYNNNNESQLLDLLIKKSHLVSLLLYSMSYNFESLQIMNNGGPMNKYFESLLKASYISINDQLPAFIRSTEMTATAWSRVGNPVLSDVYNEVSVESANKQNDKLSIQVRSNFLRFMKGETEIAYKNLEKLKKEVITTDHSLFNAVQVRSLIILIKLNLNKGRVMVCKELIEVLMDNEIKVLELRNELLILKIEIEIHLLNFSKALTMISESLNDLGNSDIYLIIKLNLLKCRIFDLSENQTKGLSLIMQQIQQAKNIGFGSIVVEGLNLLTSMLNNMGYYGDCYLILTEIMPMVLAVGNKEFISDCYYELARCCFDSYKNKGDHEMFNKVLTFLNLGIVGYKSCVNLVKLTKCFEFEQQVADLKGDKNLKKHCQESISKLELRAQDEAEYRFL